MSPESLKNQPLPLSLPAVEERLTTALEGSLPGVEAQRVLAPQPRVGWPPAEFPVDTRLAAALLLLFPKGDEAHIVLTVRAPHLARHGGQVSLPGGVVDPGETVEAAALREAREEIGLEPGAVRLLGALTPLFIMVSRFHLHPIVGVSREPVTLGPASPEVDRILEVPLGHLLSPSRLLRTVRTRDGQEYQVPYFAIEDVEVWGATAMVLSELLWLLGHRVVPEPWEPGG